MKNASCVLAVCVSLSACSLLPDRSLEYLQAKTVPNIETVSTEQRPIKPLYAIPTVTTASENTAQLIQGEGRKQAFVVPAPRSVVVAATEVPMNPVANHASKPDMVFDGNSYPLLHVKGNSIQVWEQLGQALQGANVLVVDRNQSLGLYFIEWIIDNKKQTYLLKLTPAALNNVIAVQKDDDNLVESSLSQQVLAKIIKHWPS